jgi:hypothetical protein
MKSKVPAFVCMAVLLACCWSLYRNREGQLDRDKYKVEITVTGPDGKIIPAIRPR